MKKHSKGVPLPSKHVDAGLGKWLFTDYFL